MSVMDVAVLNLSGRYFHFQARWLVAWFVFVFCLCFLSGSSGGSWQSHFHSKSAQVNAEQSAADLKSLVAMSWKVGISVTPYHTVPEGSMISNVPIQSTISHCILWKSDHFQCNYSALNDPTAMEWAMKLKFFDLTQPMCHVHAAKGASYVLEVSWLYPIVQNVAILPS